MSAYNKKTETPDMAEKYIRIKLPVYLIEYMKDYQYSKNRSCSLSQEKITLSDAFSDAILALKKNNDVYLTKRPRKSG